MAKESFLSDLELLIGMGKDLFVEDSPVTIESFNQAKEVVKEEAGQFKDDIKKLEELLAKSEELLSGLATDKETFSDEIGNLEEILPQLKSFKSLFPEEPIEEIMEEAVEEAVEEATMITCLRCGFDNERDTYKCAQCGFVFPYLQTSKDSGSFYEADQGESSEGLEKIPLEQSSTYLKIKELAEGAENGTIDMVYYRDTVNKGIMVMKRAVEALNSDVVKQKIAHQPPEELELIEKTKIGFMRFKEALEEMALYVQDGDNAHAQAGFVKAVNIMEELDTVQDSAISIALEKGYTLPAK